MTNRYEEASDAARKFLEDFDEIDLAEMLASSNATAATLNARITELEQQLADADGELAEAREHNDRTCEAVTRAEQAEADRDRVQQAACRTAENLRNAVARAEQAEDAIERVRQLCELTITASVRAQAVQQALDALAALDQPQQPTT